MTGTGPSLALPTQLGISALTLLQFYSDAFQPYPLKRESNKPPSLMNTCRGEPKIPVDLRVKFRVTVMAVRRFFRKFFNRTSEPNDLAVRKFYNRTSELNDLRNHLTPVDIGHPGKMVLVTGPRQSGKSALLQEFCSRQRAGDYPGVPAFVDMREWSNIDPSKFWINLGASFEKSLQLKGKAPAKLGLKVFSMPKLRRLGLGLDVVSSKQDPIGRVMAGLEEYTSAMRMDMPGFLNGFPTIFIDEADALASWTRTAGGVQELDYLLRFLVRISKQENAANVVLASSENFFKKWLCDMEPFLGHKVVRASVGHFNEEEAKEFVRQGLQESDLNREGLEAEVLAIWDDVYAHYGGAIMLLYDLLHMALRSQPGEVCKNWEVAKQQCMNEATCLVEEGFHPNNMGKANKMVKAAAWTPDDWKNVVGAMAATEDGVLPFHSLSVSGLESMVRYNFLEYREPTGWDKDIKAISTPIFMPVTRAQHLAMRQVVTRPSRHN
ncbi:hypothetical protein SELMODRAFT_413500 [Selaginella moellendorffii]|uniref:ATPase domain-containing protein n=1 Tax=Selaginella moellendorffii TaxID=88036 RepID=D8RPP2_SELML|nr:hypothetical protein SELMODRAFT_413500 [Selaginella moellendorffii]